VLYSGVQAHYTAAPLFDGMADPLPRRSGVRDGLEDCAALIIPPPDAKRPHEPGAGGYEPGLGVDAYLAQIGGPAGFRIPIRAAIASYVAIHGSAAEVQPLYRAIREAIRRAEPDGDLGRYSDDEHLDKITDWIKQQHGDQPPKGEEPPPHVTDPDIPPVPEEEVVAATGPFVIRVTPGLRHLAADAGLAAMHAARVPFYLRGAALVRCCRVKAKSADGTTILVPGIMPVPMALLARELGLAAQWEKLDRDGIPRRIDPPGEVVEQIAAMVDQWPFPPLAGVIGCPTLRPDGSLLVNEGYDLATGLVLHNADPLPPISENPTWADADRAAHTLWGLLDEFPFVDNPSKAVAMSQLITPVVRGAMTVAPLHLSTAPQPGTGKSYLADVASMIATGEQCAVMSAAPNPEETEKRLIGHALSGVSIISIDNCRELLQGDFLCQLTERPILSMRRLGFSEPVRAANTVTVFANGNNVAAADDLVRRQIAATLDANEENPEKRTFRKNPVAMVRQNRGAYIAACLTICRAYIAAGRPNRKAPIESYGQWSDLVRSALCWLGYADPCDTMERARAADPIREDRTAVFIAWRDELDVEAGHTVNDLVTLATETNLDGDVRPNLRAALFAIAAGSTQKGSAPTIDTRRLGKWLVRNENTIIAGLKLGADRGDQRRPRWRLEAKKHP
jgi:putative DNA primase/helicase